MPEVFRKPWFLVTILFFCNTVKTKDFPKDTGNYVKIGRFEWNYYSNSNYLSPYNNQTFPFNGTNVISLTNISSQPRNWVNYTMYFDSNSLPVEDVKSDGGGSHPRILPGCTSGTRYTSPPISRVRLFQNGITSRTFEDCTRPQYQGTSYILVKEDCVYAINAGTILLSSGFSVASDITTGNYTLRFYDGNDIEFYSVSLIVSP